MQTDKRHLRKNFPNNKYFEMIKQTNCNHLTSALTLDYRENENTSDKEPAERKGNDPSKTSTLPTQS